MAHISDDLPLLLTGDATREVVLAAASHLRTCVDCQQELVSAVIAHASLTSAHRFAPEIVTSEDDAGARPPQVDDVAPLPDLSELFAEVRSDAPPTAEAARPGRMRRRLVAVAAAAVVAGGGVTAYALIHDSGPVSRTVALTGTLGASSGKVRLVGDNRMVVNTQLPAPATGEQYEVWLTGSDDGRQAVGYLHDGTVDMTIPGDVMQKYKGVAVSVQRNGQTEFSGRVVLSGKYG